MSAVEPRRTTRASTRINPSMIASSSSTDILPTNSKSKSASTSRLPMPSSSSAPSGLNERKSKQLSVASASTTSAMTATGAKAGLLASRKTAASATAARLKANQENLVGHVGAGPGGVGGGAEGKGKGKAATTSGKPVEGGNKKPSTTAGGGSTTTNNARRDRTALTEVPIGQHRGAAQTTTNAQSQPQGKRQIKPLPSSSSGESLARAHGAGGVGGVGKGQDLGGVNATASTSASTSRPGMARRSTRTGVGAGAGVPTTIKEERRDAVKRGESSTSGTGTSTNGTRRSLKRTLTATASAGPANIMKEEEAATVAEEDKIIAKDAATALKTIEPSPKRMRTSTPATGTGGDEDREAAFDEDELALRDEVNPAHRGQASNKGEDMMDVEDEEGKGEYVIAEDGSNLNEVEVDEEAAKERFLLDQESKVEGDWIDLDQDDENDPTMVTEYVKDIFAYMKRLELTTMPNPDYIDSQTHLKWEMRGVLMDWIIEVHHKFRLLPETLFLATNMIDRFLSARVVSLQKLQLVGLTCLFVAAKYEEVVCPSVTNFLHMADGGYEDEEILTAEKYVLSTLNFDLSYPNPIHFLRRVSKADGFDVDVRTVGKYFIEISCVDHRMLHVKPSLLAAAGIYLARLVLDRGPWDATLAHFSTYSEEQVVPTAQLMLDYIVTKEVSHECFYKKYASKKYMKASSFVRLWASSRFPKRHESTEGVTYGIELIQAFEHKKAHPEEYAEGDDE